MLRCATLIGVLLAGQMAVFGGEDPGAEVRRLVRQLDAPQLAQREAAEAELLRRGSAVLDLLPPATDRVSAEVQQRLGRIRQRLQEAAADAAVNASTIILVADATPLSEILRAFQQQSGNTILDYRRQFGQPTTDPKLSVRFGKKPFWPALDRLLDQAGLTVYPYGQQRAISVVAALGDKRIARSGRASYSGPLRFEPISIVARRDLRQADSRSLVVTLEAAWEPRLRIISLRQRMAEVQAVDERGGRLPVVDPAAQPELSVGSETTAVKLDLPLMPPPRDVRQIASLKGNLLATILGRIETFRFGELADAKNVQQRIAGVTVTLEQVRSMTSPLLLGEGQGLRAASGESGPHPNPLPKGEGTKAESPLPKGEGTGWEVRMTVRFDDAGDALASHRQWVFSNEAHLEGPDGKPIAYDGYETTAQGKNELGLAYVFRTDRPLGELTFVYKTPGTIVTRAFDYELKNLELP
jgi:hypothetical protein